MCIEAKFPAVLFVLTKKMRAAVENGTRSEAKEVLTDIELFVEYGLEWFQQMQEEDVSAKPAWSEFINAKNS